MMMMMMMMMMVVVVVMMMTTTAIMTSIVYYCSHILMSLCNMIEVEGVRRSVVSRVAGSRYCQSGKGDNVNASTTVQIFQHYKFIAINRSVRRGGSLVESIAVDRRVVGSHPALAAT